MPPGYCNHLSRLLKPATYLRQERQTDKVREYFSTPLAIPAPFQTAVEPAVSRIENLINGCGIDWPVLADWAATDIAVQKYGQDDGISRHRDYTDDVGLIVLLTIQGRGRLQVFENGEVDPWLDIVAGVGDLLLLRGVGLTGGIETRPEHQVGGARGSQERISIGMRFTTELRGLAT